MKSQLANLMSAGRLVAGPVILAVPNHHGVVWWIFAAALASDYLDGILARRLRIVSSRGQQLDSIADTTLAACGIVYLGASGWLPHWAVIAVIGMVAGALYAHGSQLWECVSVRLAAGVTVIALYGLIATGTAVLAFGGHLAIYVAASALTVSLTWLCRDRIKCDLDLEIAQAPNDST